MRAQLQRRLEVLRKEFDTGQTRLRDLEMQQLSLRETLWRISGAIQVLEELLDETKADEGNEAPSVAPQHVSLPAG